MPNKKSPTKKRSKQTSKSRPTKTKKQEATKPKARAKLPSVLDLSLGSFKILWRNKKLFAFVILIYTVAYLILVIGFSSPASVSSIKSAMNSVSGGHSKSLYSGLGGFTYLIGSSASSSSSTGSAYQVIILILASLAIIWCLRKIYLNEKIKARDAYYKGLYPLAPYILVLLFICLELIPLVFALGLYSTLIQGGIAITALEKIVATVLSIGLAAISCYLVTASVMALYIVTLIDMTPLKALRSAKGLIKKRRLLVFRKLIFLPVILLIVGVIIMLPFLLIIPAVATWLFFILSMLALAYVHSYCYALYRGLINEQE